MIEVTGDNVKHIAAKLAAGELPSPAKSLAEAVCRVMESVGYVQKDKQMMGGGNYRYASIEAVIDKLRPEMIRHGLVLLPTAVKPLRIEVVEGKNNRQNRTQVKYTFDLIHWPSKESKEVVVIGEGMDVGDKSSNKAMTAARKYAMVMIFNLETGTDPDDTPSASQERSGNQPADNHVLRAHYTGALAKASTMPEGVTLYRQYEADIAAGQLSPADRTVIDAAFKQFKMRHKTAASGPVVNETPGTARNNPR